MKKVLALLLSLCLVFIQIPLQTNATEIIDSGECGSEAEPLTWQVTKSGTLTISGTGKMRDYILSYSYAPWTSHKYRIKKVVIEEGVTGIGNYAFFNLNYLVSVSLPQSLTFIGNGAFYRCIALPEISLPPNLTELGFEAFKDCGELQSITIPDGITEINGNCFEYCSSLKEVHLPDGICFFGPYAFSGTPIKEIYIPNTVTRIGVRAFQGCCFTEITIPDSVIAIGEFAFSGSSLKSVVIPNSITKINDGTFMGCRLLTTVVLPENLESIGSKAFQNCSSLKDITFPKRSFSLGNEVFTGCNNLFELNFIGDPPVFSENTFYYYTGIARYPAENKSWTASVMQNYGGKITWVDDSHVHSFTTFVTEPTCEDGGYSQDVCSGCGAVITHSRVYALGHDVSDATCTEPATCRREGCDYTDGRPLGHAWDDPAASPRTCTRCNFVDDHKHNYTAQVIEPKCVTSGYTKYICTVCNYAYADNYVDALGHDIADATCVLPSVCKREGCGYRKGTALGHVWENPCLTTRTCSVCGESDNNGGHDWFDPYDKNRYCLACGHFEGKYFLDLTEISGEIWIDGVISSRYITSGAHWAFIENPDAKVMIAYTYENGSYQDPHARYPKGMKVYKLTLDGDRYIATHIEALDNLLQYSGSSIRISGTKGIRMITAIEKSKKEALTGKGLAGYKLVEYGTALCWAKDLEGRKPMVLGKDYVKSNYAYKRGVADPIFTQTKDLVQYTNVLVGFNLTQCKDDIAMRPYIILEDADGQQITLYGGIVYRSIGYIAYQNRNVFKPGTSTYEYVWEIIHHVYGNKYDSDYQG